MEVLINHVNIFKVTIIAGLPRIEMQELGQIKILFKGLYNLERLTS